MSKRNSSVTYVDLGLSTLEGDAEMLLIHVLDVSAAAVEARMKRLIIERDFVETRATVNSVAVSAPKPLVRDIGPSTEYAIYGELGFVQTTKTIGDPKQPKWIIKNLTEPIHHAGLHFARDALASVRTSFLAAVGAAVQRLGKG